MEFFWYIVAALGAGIGTRCGRRHLQWLGGVMLIVLAGCRLL